MTKAKWTMHPKQKAFMEAKGPMCLYGGRRPSGPRMTLHFKNGSSLTFSGPLDGEPLRGSRLGYFIVDDYDEGVPE